MRPGGRTRVLQRSETSPRLPTSSLRQANSSNRSRRGARLYAGFPPASQTCGSIRKRLPARRRERWRRPTREFARAHCRAKTTTPRRRARQRAKPGAEDGATRRRWSPVPAHRARPDLPSCHFILRSAEVHHGGAPHPSTGAILGKSGEPASPLNAQYRAGFVRVAVRNGGCETTWIERWRQHPLS